MFICLSVFLFAFTAAGAENEVLIQSASEISPVKAVDRGIFSVKNKTIYGDSNTYSYAIYEVDPLKKYYITGASATNASSYPAGAFYDSAGEWIESFGESPSKIYRNLLVTAPENASTMVLNRNNGLAHVSVFSAVEVFAEEDYDLDAADILINTSGSVKKQG